MTQNERILAILADGEWHEKSDFYSFCVLHSRIAELRKRGHVFEIEKRHGGRTVWYRLATLPESGEGATGPLVASGTPGSGSVAPRSVPPRDDPGRDDGLTASALPGSAPLQLSIEAA